MESKLGFKPVPTAIAVGLALIIWFIIPVPDGVTPQAWHLLAMFVGVIAAIIGKAMPIGAIAMIAIMLVALTGVTSDKPADAVKDALSSFSSPLIWLIGVAIMISRGILKTGLGARIGYLFIAVWGKKTIGIGYSLALSELLLAPVTPSNTARGGGIIHPVMKAIASSYDSDPEKGTQGRIGKYLALVNYHGNPITSAMFITATAPNPLVVDIIAKATNSDIHLSWGTWALAMLLPGLVAMLVMPLVIYAVYPPEIKETPNAAQFAKERLHEMGPMNRGEKIMLGIFFILLMLWAGIPAMIMGDAWKVDATTTALIGLSLLLLTGVLSWAGWAAMLAMPFTFVTNALQGYGHMGAYLGLFNGTICIPQIVAAICGGTVLSLVGSHQSDMMIVAGILLIAGALSVSIIKDKKSE